MTKWRRPHWPLLYTPWSQPEEGGPSKCLEFGKFLTHILINFVGINLLILFVHVLFACIALHAHSLLVSKNMYSVQNICYMCTFSVFPIAYMYFLHLFGAGINVTPSKDVELFLPLLQLFIKLCTVNVRSQWKQLVLFCFVFNIHGIYVKLMLAHHE